MSILEVNNVSKFFGGVKANEDISLTVEQDLEKLLCLIQ